MMLSSRWNRLFLRCRSIFKATLIEPQSPLFCINLQLNWVNNSSFTMGGGFFTTSSGYVLVRRKFSRMILLSSDSRPWMSLIISSMRVLSVSSTAFNLYSVMTDKDFLMISIVLGMLSGSCILKGTRYCWPFLKPPGCSHRRKVWLKNMNSSRSSS